MIYRYSEYKKLNEKEGISKDKFESLLEKNCKNWIADEKHSKILFRYKKTDKDKFKYIQPSKFKESRLSRTEVLWLPILFDILPSWKNYPKRTRSIFTRSCSEIDSDDSDISVVIPFDNSKIGMCKGYDFNYYINWPEIIDRLDPKLDDLDLVLEMLFGSLYDTVYKNYEYTKDMDRPTDIKQFFNFIDNQQSDDYDLDDLMISDSDLNSKLLNRFLQDFKLNNNKGILDYIDDLLNPDKNKFKLFNNYVPNKIQLDRECWTDGDCLLIDSKEYVKLF